MSSSNLVGDLKNFVEARSSTNENFKFWYQFLERHEIELDLLRADREGLWQLHFDAMQRALYEFAAWDSTNYLRWGTVYLEDARNLPETAPTVYSHFADGHSFSIKDKPGRFSAVGGWSEAWADHQSFIKVQWWHHWTRQAKAIHYSMGSYLSWNDGSEKFAQRIH